MHSDALNKYLAQFGAEQQSGEITTTMVDTENMRTVVSELINNFKLDLKLITATDEREDGGGYKVWYIFGFEEEKSFLALNITLKDTIEFPSIVDLTHRAWNYERKIKTFFGLSPTGHPDQRPIILHENWPTTKYPLRKDFDLDNRPKETAGVYEFLKVQGEGIYEIPVGPIHAGIIEPGHFRFSVAGEEIMYFEPRLGYVHKGSEKLFEAVTLGEGVRLSEKISGDSSFSHSLAYVMALEKLSNTLVPMRAKYLRTIFAELERLANHCGDIGAMMVDTGFNFGGAQGARLREEVMQINERLTGSRFLRGVNIVGGVTKDISETDIKALSKQLEVIKKDFAQIIDIAEHSASLLNRLQKTGAIAKDVAKDHGATGVAAKAVGIAKDARVMFPYAAYAELGFQDIVTADTGDVYARFQVRIGEVLSTISIIQKALASLPAGDISTKKVGVLAKNQVTVSVVEGWRGEIVYFVCTDSQGKIARVAPRDPSFVNWSLLQYACPGNIVPDFPLINKSFNLSYSGYDL